MKIRLIVLFLTGLLWITCSKKSGAPTGSNRETYSGELSVDRGLDSVGGEATDTISFILDMPFYSLLFATRHANLCDSEGKVTGFGEPAVKFEPSRTFGFGCDSLRVPNGVFNAVFYGDTAVVMTRTDYSRSISYVLRLRR